MNSHFQSSDTACIVSCSDEPSIGFAGSRWWAPSQATPPSRMTVRAGIDQTTSSMRPEYSQSGQYDAFVLDARNQKAKAKIATIVGRTIASMIAIESIRMVLSAAPIGPCGSRIFIAEPENEAADYGTAAPRFRRRNHMTRIDERLAQPCEVAKGLRLT